MNPNFTPESFCYWLQGFSEIHGKKPTEKQWLIIQDHLKLVFNKVTPDRTALNPNWLQPIYGTNPPVFPLDGIKIFNPSGLNLQPLISC